MPTTPLLSLLRQARSAPGASPPESSLVITPGDRQLLVRRVRDANTPSRFALRSVAILLAAAGWTDTRIAEALGVNRRSVAHWKARYRRGGVIALVVDRSGRGRKRGRDRAIVQKILDTTRQPPPDQTRWTVRALARAVGVSHATVQRVWREHGFTRSRHVTSSPADTARATSEDAHS